VGAEKTAEGAGRVSKLRHERREFEEAVVLTGGSEVRST
jgi:hypothetical protein